MAELVVGVAECACRIWQVSLYHPLRRCGECRQQPQLVSPEKRVTW